MRQSLTAEQVEKDRPAWLAARVADGDGPRIGASEVGAVLGLRGAHDSPRSLWMKKTGQWGPDEEMPDFVEFGNYCENFAAWLLARQQPGWHVTPGGLYADDDHPWMTATFDRLMHDDTVGCPNCAATPPTTWPRPAPVQLKNCAFADWTETGIPPAYTAQVIWETAIARAERGYLVAFDRNAVKIQVIVVEMDDAAQASLKVMTEAAEEFRDLVMRRVPPPADGHPATTEALKRQFGDIDREAIAVLPRRDAERWWRARHAKDAADDRRRLYLNRLLARAGNAGQWHIRDAAGGTVKIASRSASPRAGYWAPPVPKIDAVRPSRGWTPDSSKETS
jgi:predicted phage-related endonuclease